MSNQIHQQEHPMIPVVNIVLTGTALVATIVFFHTVYLSVTAKLLNPPFVPIQLKIDPRSQKPVFNEFCDLTTSHYNSNNEYLIDTQGCRIRKYANLVDNDYEDEDRVTKECKRRAVSVQKISENQIQFLIHDEHRPFKLEQCMYQFVIWSKRNGYQDLNVINFSNPKYFINGTIAHLEHEIINITCQHSKNKKATSIIYQDIYMIVKKKKENSIQNMANDVVNKWNVLLLGLDTMSRARVYRTMPKTTCFLKQYGWLDYNAYHNIASNTYLNIKALVTGSTNIFDDKTRRRIIWNIFQSQGYVTAHGEDKISDAFKTHDGFDPRPVDHSMRPLFDLGETIQQGTSSCIGTLFSGIHILNYALDFAETYHKSNPFFGFFWINFSHNLHHNPSQIDKLFKKFFKNLNDSGILNSTFVVFFSDHGIRFGSQRYMVRSYYDTRLPMLFLRVPESFQKLYSDQYSNAVTNQQRLLTPYDHHATLLDILKLSESNSQVPLPICHTHCLSIFDDHSVARTCADANISDQWCGCHTLNREQIYASATKKCTNVMAELVQQRIISIQTIKCTKCEPVELKSVLRVHAYEIDHKKYFVIAISVTVTDNVYEGVVVQNGDNYEVIGGVEVISQLTVFDNCALDMNLKRECKCLIDENCRNKSNSNFNFNKVPKQSCKS